MLKRNIKNIYPNGELLKEALERNNNMKKTL